MISRFNLDQKRLTFYENPELFHKEFIELISSNNDNEFLYSTEEPIVVLNRDKTLKLTLVKENKDCLLYTSPSPRDSSKSRMPSSA